MSYQLKKIRKIIESIKNTDIFQQAFLHTSYLNELKLKRNSEPELDFENNPKYSYETLEFLGDSVLNFYAALFIYHKFPNYAEGQMSKLKQLMVQESTLAHLSREIGLNKVDENGKLEYLKLGEGERKNGGADKESILADIFESFVAALYLEKGGKSVYRFLSLTIFTWSEGKENMVWDYKSQLQEYCQAQKNMVFYRLKAMRGEGQQRQLFTAKVYDKLGTFSEIGVGKNKKEASQNAAAKVIKKLGIEKISKIEE